MRNTQVLICLLNSNNVMFEKQALIGSLKTIGISKKGLRFKSSAIYPLHHAIIILVIVKKQIS